MAVAILCVLTSPGCDDGTIREERLPKGVEATGEAPDPPRQTADTTTDSHPAEAAPWTVPAGWMLSPEPRPMRIATFSVQADAAPVEVAITRFEGEAGGTLANVNRWRGQVGLPEVDAAGLEGVVTRVGSEDWPGYMLRINGPEQHMLAAGVFERAADRTWFMRATGAPDVIDALQADFEAFVRSIGQPELP